MMRTAVLTITIAVSTTAVGAGVNVSVNQFELSGCAFVEGGVLVADDELVSSIVFVPDDGAGQGTIVRVQRKRKQSKPFTDQPHVFAVQDFEGLASVEIEGEDDPEKRYKIYAIGSHEPHKKNNERRVDREFLIRSPEFKRDDSELGDADGIRDLLVRMERGLKAAEIDIQLSKKKVLAKLNIEGLAADGDRLTVGFRFPLTAQGHAILFRASEADLFEKPAEDVEGEVLILDMGGRGVRGLCALEPERLVVLAGPPEDEDLTSQIYLYDGASGNTTLLHTLDTALPGAPEGIAVRDSGEFLVVLDAGSDGPGSIHRVQLDLP